MVRPFVVFALLQAVAWIRRPSLHESSSSDDTNVSALRSSMWSMHDAATLSGMGGSIVCIALAITSLVRRSSRAVERVLWLLVAPAMTIPGWRVWYPIALGV